MQSEAARAARLVRAQEEVQVEDEHIATRQVFNQLDVEKASREEKSKAGKLKAGQKEPPPGPAMQEEQPVRSPPPLLQPPSFLLSPPGRK